MNVQRLDHFLLRTEKLEETKQFFTEVLGFVVGPRPPFKFPGYWLYNAGIPVVHLSSARDEGVDAYLGASDAAAAGGGCGALDHVAFRCSGYAEMQARLRTMPEIRVFERSVPGRGEHQVFVHDPNGLRIELIFPAHERDGLDDLRGEGASEVSGGTAVGAGASVDGGRS